MLMGTFCIGPCAKCGRDTEEDCESYERRILIDFQELYTARGESKRDAWESAKRLVAAIDLFEGQKKGKQE
jgi:hypothetical protein